MLQVKGIELAAFFLGNSMILLNFFGLVGRFFIAIEVTAGNRYGVKNDDICIELSLIVSYCGKRKQENALLLDDLLLEIAKTECESEGANKMIAYLRELISTSKAGDKYGRWKCCIQTGSLICVH
nr:phosphoglucomutase, chloroplastic [Ipomoea trifida]